MNVAKEMSTTDVKALVEYRLLDSLVIRVLASSTGGPGFNPQSRTASYQRRYKKWYK